MQSVLTQSVRLARRSSMRSHALRTALCCLVLTLLPTTRAAAQNGQGAVAPIIAALQQHDFPSALKLSDSVLAHDPQNYRVWTLRGMANGGIDDLPQALASYQHALQLSPNYLPALEGAAQTEFHLGKHGARQLLLKILARRPDDPPTHLLLGMLDARESDCAHAIEHFAKADRLISTDRGALTEYGVCLSHLKRPDDAVQVFRKALDLDPARPEARYNLALAQSEDNQGAEALDTLKPMLQSAAVSSDALALSAEILESQQDTPQAVALLRQALLADPKNVDAYLRFASLSFDHSSPQAGIDILNSGLTQLPNEPRLYLVRGILLTQLGEFSRAADDFETANRLSPRMQFLSIAQGLVQSQQHNPDQALAKFRTAVKLHPHDAYAHYLLAEALDGNGKPPGSPEYQEELAAATAAVKLDPKLAAARDLLSSIYLENGQTQLAIDQSEAAIAVDPNDEQAVYHLIVAFRKTGQKDQLPALLKRLLELRAKQSNRQPGAKRYRLTVEDSSTTAIR